MQKLFLPLLFSTIFISKSALARQSTATQDSIRVQITRAAGSIYFLDCINGFGGGNVAASIGDDGILLVDDMYASMQNRLDSALKTVSAKPIRIIFNTHFHGDHIAGNANYRQTAIIIGHENLATRLRKNNKEAAPTIRLIPQVSFTDSLHLQFNSEDILLLHYPSSHTDGDAIVYFSGSRVLHLGDLFFFEMFPAVYTSGGGNLEGLVTTLEKILARFPSDAKVIPGHGRIASMQDLKDYLIMLKETIDLVKKGITEGLTLQDMTNRKILSRYDKLGEGGAQTTDQYLAMLYKLISGK